MKSSTCSTVFLCLCCLFFTLQAAQRNEGAFRTASAMGESVESALHKAQRDALWEYAQTLSDRSFLREYEQKVEEFFQTHREDLIVSSEILEKKSRYGVYETTVRLRVNEDFFIDSFEAEGFLVEEQVEKPRVMVLLEEYEQNTPVHDNIVTHVIEGALTAQGYQLLEEEQLERVRQEDTDGEDLAALGFAHGADIIIRGRVDIAAPRVQTAYGVSQVSVPVNVNVRVIRADNAEIITSLSERVLKRTLDEYTARDDGLREGGEIISAGIDAAISAYWREHTRGLRRIELLAHSQSEEKLYDLESSFAKIPQIKQGHLRYVEQGRAVYDVEVLGTVQALRRQIEQHGVWRISALAPGRIALQEGERTTPGKISYDIDMPSLSVRSAQIEPIFPSRLRYYEENDIAEITVAGGGEQVDDLRVHVFIPRLMDMPTERAVSFSQGGEKTLSMPLLLNEEKLLEFSAERQVPAEVSLSYTIQGRRESREIMVPVRVYTRNGLDWNNLPSLGSFVTYQNPTIDRFARYVVAEYDRSTSLPDDLSDAIAIFSALREHGFTYVSDPVNIAASGLDQVYFPVQTLEKRTGDCDDFAVLYAALLSAIGIPTAFIVYDDHVLTMFNTGVYEKNADILGVDRNRVIIHNNQCWIPVETTMLSDTFFDAWSAAAQQFRQTVADGGRFDIVEVATAWQTYRPFDYRHTIDLPLENLLSSVTVDLSHVYEYARNSMFQAIEDLESRDTLSLTEKNRLGRLYARSGDFLAAREHFSGLVELYGESRAVRNNYACALLLTGDDGAAIGQIEEALTRGSFEEGLINKGLFYYVSDRSDGMDVFSDMVREVYTKTGSLDSFDRLLGIPVSTEPTERATDHSGEEQQIDRSRLQDMIRQQVLEDDFSGAGDTDSYGGNVMPFGGVRGADPTQIAEIADLLVWMDL
ncbi:transglutaminase-like domain-containing protein [Chitinivibrio alkaliphilus]|nr:transglutaminase-like domain-containing protein [Chitinivibrio alkaliphilus]